MSEENKKTDDFTLTPEIITSDAESLARRREELKTMSRGQLEAVIFKATDSLNDTISKHPNKVLVSDPKFARQQWQITLPVGEEGESITIHSARLTEGRRLVETDIYFGESSVALEANPTARPKFESDFEIYSFMSKDDSVNATLTDIEDILVAETLTERLMLSAADANTVAEAGKVALGTEVG